MEQIAVSFTSVGVPATGLTPTVDIWEKNGNKIITAGVLKELAGGWYIYDFNQYNNEKVYLYTFDGGVSLADSDRYKHGGNDLDAYSNKYSWGRTAIPATNYKPDFGKLENVIKTQKYPTYDDTEVKRQLRDLSTFVSSKTDDSILQQIANLQNSIGELNIKLEGSTATNIGKLGEEMSNLMNNLQTIKDEIGTSIKETEGNVSNMLNNVHGSISKNMEQKLSPEYLNEHMSKPITELHKKIEDLFISMVNKNVPDNILNQFDIKLTKKDDTEALKELEDMIKDI